MLFTARYLMTGLLLHSLTVFASETEQPAIFAQEASAQPVLQPPLKKQRVEKISAMSIDADFKETFAREQAAQQKLDDVVEFFNHRYMKLFDRNAADLTQEKRLQEAEKFRSELINIQSDSDWPMRAALYQVATSRGFNLESFTYSQSKFHPPSPLQDAVKSSDTTCARFLLAHKADVHERCKSTGKKNPLLAYAPTLSVAQLLLEHKADINGTDDNQQTCLWFKHGKQNVALLSFLVSCGANACAVDADNETPLDRFYNELEAPLPPEAEYFNQATSILVSAGIPLNTRSTVKCSVYKDLTIIEKLRVKIKLGILPKKENKAFLELIQNSALTRTNRIKEETSIYLGRHLAHIVDEYDATGRFDQTEEEIDKLARQMKLLEMEPTKPASHDSCPFPRALWDEFY